MRFERLSFRPVHVRRTQSSNRDWKILDSLLKSRRTYKVKIGRGEIESIITNSSELAKKLQEERCDSVEAIERLLEKEVKEKTEREFIRSFCEAKTSIPTKSTKNAKEEKARGNWEGDKKGFEQHMAEEETVRLN